MLFIDFGAGGYAHTSIYITHGLSTAKKIFSFPIYNKRISATVKIQNIAKWIWNMEYDKIWKQAQAPGHTKM